MGLLHFCCKLLWEERLIVHWMKEMSWTSSCWLWRRRNINWMWRPGDFRQSSLFKMWYDVLPATVCSRTSVIFCSLQTFSSWNTAVSGVTLKGCEFAAWLTRVMCGSDQCSYHVQFNFLQKPELIKIIDGRLNAEGLVTPLKLIAFLPVSLQTLNLESVAFWQGSRRRQMTGFKQWRGGRKWLTNRQSSVHIIPRPWQASPCMNSKLVKHGWIGLDLTSIMLISVVAPLYRVHHKMFWQSGGDICYGLSGETGTNLVWWLLTRTGVQSELNRQILRPRQPEEIPAGRTHFHILSLMYSCAPKLSTFIVPLNKHSTREVHPGCLQQSLCKLVHNHPHAAFAQIRGV